MVPALASGALAQGAATPRTRTVVSDDATDSGTVLQELPTVKLSYDDLRRTYKPDADATLASVRADAASNSGRVVEFAGRISGVMSTSKGRTVIFNQDENIAVFPMTLDLPGAELISAGQDVRGLFLITLDNAEVILKPLAFSAAPAPTRLPRAIAAAINTSPAGASPGSAIVLPPVQTDDNGVIVAPQTGDLSLPGDSPMTRMSQPQRSLSDRINASRAVTPLAPPDNGDGQARVYDALARRFNPKLPAAQSAEIGAAIVSASRANGLDPRFLSSIIAVESDFDPYCLSNSGAMGLAQLMPFNLRGLGITNAWSPTQNINGAAKMLRRSLNEYGGRPDATLLAVAAYNAGGGAVKRAGYRVPNGSQVQRYVWKVYNQYKAFAPELFAAP